MGSFKVVSNNPICDLAKNLGACVNLNTILDAFLTKASDSNTVPSNNDEF